MDVSQHVQSVMERIRQAALAAGREPGEITLWAATKVQTDETIRAAIAAGVRVCGENRVQELVAHLAADAYAGAEQVHFIGHLQTNKVKQVVGHVDLIQSVGSAHLLQAIQNLARQAMDMSAVRLRGLMAIPPVSAQPGANKPYFAAMRQLFVDIREKMSDNENDIVCLSMGMSGDFEDAIAEGATMVRVGSGLFGPRPPMKSHLPS